jgi:5'-3' exonuclease
MKVHLIDGTYELFRHYYAVPKMLDRDGQEVAAVRGVLASILGMVQQGVTHLAVATDHVIESFRNDLWPGYKSSAGIEPDLLSQFSLLEEALTAMGVVIWPMIQYEADDALAAGARLAAEDKRVDQVIICTPDKDLAQSVVGTRIVQLDRRTRVTRDEAGVRDKFGVLPTSIPDYLAVVGDTADGFPGMAGWGAKSSAAVLTRYEHLETIPKDWRTWGVNVLNPRALSETLQSNWDQAMLFKDLATLRNDIPLFTSVDELKWTNATDAFPALAERLDAAVLKIKPNGKRK